jgi:magnesium-transporting ATPase (P-type)
MNFGQADPSLEKKSIRGGGITTAWYGMKADDVLAALRTGPEGLSREECGRRLADFGPNELEEKKRTTPLRTFLNQFRSEKAFEAMKSMTAPKARVLRDGAESLIPARDLVPGDILLLEEGDRAAAIHAGLRRVLSPAPPGSFSPAPSWRTASG